MGNRPPPPPDQPNDLHGLGVEDISSATDDYLKVSFQPVNALLVPESLKLSLRVSFESARVQELARK